MHKISTFMVLIIAACSIQPGVDEVEAMCLSVVAPWMSSLSYTEFVHAVCIRKRRFYQSINQIVI